MSSNPWVIHVKEWSKANNVSYGCAISKPECKEAYQKKKNKTNLEIAKKPLSILQAFTKIKTTAVSKQAPKVSNKKVSKAQLDTMAKDIEDLREKAGRIAEREGRMTKEVTKMLEKIKTMTKERLDLRRLFKEQQKSN
jgi:DNA phosphorothioation-dependent restriction protein DptG